MTWPCPSLKLKGPRPREESNIVPLQESGIMHRQLLKLVKRTYKSQLTVSPERDLRVQSCGLDLTSTFPTHVLEILWPGGILEVLCWYHKLMCFGQRPNPNLQPLLPQRSPSRNQTWCRQAQTCSQAGRCGLHSRRHKTRKLCTGGWPSHRTAGMLRQLKKPHKDRRERKLGDGVRGRSRKLHRISK